MAEQPQLLTDYGDSRQFEPVSTAVEGAANYTKGRHSMRGLETVQVNPRRGFRIQAAYKAAQAAPTEAPGIRKSYEAMRQEVNRQYEFMTRSQEQGGMGITHSIHEQEPYGFHWAGGSDEQAAQEMSEDVRQNRHIKTLATSATGPHEFFSDEENDKFRAVHDVFGHAATGRGFSRNGEEAAYLSHRQMFPRAAQAAMASETRGQNSFLNYGATMADPVKRFPDQDNKLVGLPNFAQAVARRKGG